MEYNNYITSHEGGYVAVGDMVTVHTSSKTSGMSLMPSDCISSIVGIVDAQHTNWRRYRMARRAFYSFYYKPDNWRASEVRNMGVVEGNRPASDNDWEEVKKGGEAAIKKWINEQMSGKSVAIVLIGSNTAGRKWIKYEIKKAWDDGKGLLGVYIHNLKNQDGEQSSKGRNAFDDVTVGGKKLSSIVKAYDPPYKVSKNVYDHIKGNLADWIETAIDIRDNHS